MMTVLLINCYTCICDNQVEVRFEMRPPSLHDYLTAEIEERVKEEVKEGVKEEIEEEVEEGVEEGI